MKNVALPRTTAFITLEKGFTDLRIITLAPTVIGRSRHTMKEKAWNMGRKRRKRSFLVTLNISTPASALDRRFLCVSTAPLGFPVVPEV